MRRVAALAALAVALLAAGAVALATNTETAKPAISKTALAAYEAAVLPVVQDGGKVVQLGMKPAMDDLRNRHVVPAKVIAFEADGWVRSLLQVRARMAKVQTPVQLEQVTQRFLQALDGYVAAAREFARATRTTGPQRLAAIDRGVTLAETADHTYDRGAALLQEARHAVGLGANPNFPGGT